jgi:hypothetical protein
MLKTRMLKTPTLFSSCLVPFGFAAWLLAGCGASPAPQAVEPTAPAPREEDPDKHVNVQGLRGTLSEHEIQRALEPRMMKFSRCVEKRSSTLEWVAGKLEFTFEVAVDGTVKNVYPSESTFGDRETERCMTEVARGTRFPPPHGGEADFSWSLDVPLDSSIREPLAWTSDNADQLIAKSGPQALSSCEGGAFAITAYVDPEGRVVAAGASTENESDATKLDCVAQQISSWAFPSPGSYAAKIVFELR